MIRLLKRFKFFIFLLLTVVSLYGLTLFFNVSVSDFLSDIPQSLFHPVAKSFRSTQNWVASGYERYQFRNSLQEENHELIKKLKATQEEKLKLYEDVQSLKRQLTHYQKLPQSDWTTIPAKVMAHDPKAALKSVILNRGRKHGLKANQAVLADGGLVGRVVQVNQHHAQVLLVSDVNSVVDVLSARSRARGTLVGRLQDLNLNRKHTLTQAEYISRHDEINPGDLLLTSGMDALFPKGIPVGVVESVKKDDTGLFWEADVVPYVELNKLEEVLVMVRN